MKRAVFRITVITCLISFWTNMSIAQQQHPFSVHDMLAMDRISDPQVSPNGKTVVFVLQTTDLEANKGRKDIWSIGTDGKGLTRLTSDPANDYNPRWTPDGKNILFISSRSGSNQVWQMAAAGGEPQQITQQPLDVGNLIIAPDGKHIAFTMDVFIGCEEVDCTKNKLKEKEECKSSGMIFDKLFIRHWDTWKDGRRSHIFVMSGRR